MIWVTCTCHIAIFGTPRANYLLQLSSSRPTGHGAANGQKPPFYNGSARLGVRNIGRHSPKVSAACLYRRFVRSPLVSVVCCAWPCVGAPLCGALVGEDGFHAWLYCIPPYFGDVFPWENAVGKIHSNCSNSQLPNALFPCLTPSPGARTM